MSDLQNLYDDVFYAHIQNVRGNYVDLNAILEKISALDGDVVVPDQPEEPEQPTVVAPAQDPKPVEDVTWEPKDFT